MQYWYPPIGFDRHTNFSGEAYDHHNDKAQDSIITQKYM